MDAMPRPRPPFLSREVSRHGRAVWYVRRNGKRIRLRAEFGTPEFDGRVSDGARRPPTSHRSPYNGRDIGVAHRVLPGHGRMAGPF